VPDSIGGSVMSLISLTPLLSRRETFNKSRVV
jgi:hypothetical protein